MNARKPLAVAARLADFVLVIGGAANLIVLFYFIYLYQWSGARRFTSASGPFCTTWYPPFCRF